MANQYKNRKIMKAGYYLVGKFKINKTTKCWEYKKVPKTNPYGTVTIRIDGKQLCLRAARVSYETFVGKIPKGLFVLHKCDNPPCINPNHLFLGTNRDNMGDMKNKGRSRCQKLKKCIHGHRYTEQNTIREKQPNGNDRRRCRICYNKRVKEIRLAKATKRKAVCLPT